jgi:hypothetical protein
VKYNVHCNLNCLRANITFEGHAHSTDGTINDASFTYVCQSVLVTNDSDENYRFPRILNTKDFSKSGDT